MAPRADIVMITYRSAGYVHLSLPRLLETLGPDDRVWLWHNGDDEATIEAVRPFRKDDRVARYHHSRDNVRLREPTNWLWDGSDARFVSKVDDDCLVASGWLDTFTAAHDANPQFGAIGSWRHPEEDLRPELARHKIQSFAGGHSLLRNLWVQGSGYLLPRSLVQAHGPLRPNESFTAYCIRLARAGAVNGFYHPFVPEDHMDDPRSPHTLIREDADLADRMPLSARANGVTTVDQWVAQLRQSALVLQTASLDPCAYAGWRRRWSGVRRRARSIAGRPARW
ncbi:glycosyltransferase [Nocardioides xinjiangensis]|uniref:glycosyltransferase n=1 Tax=Nocardioides xinjiangensis TaxID=2817376 RepID=UPI0027DC24A3|nr:MULTISPECIES: glycosyltransferase [unclassified Nocardioides]